MNVLHYNYILLLEKAFFGLCIKEVHSGRNKGKINGIARFADFILRHSCNGTSAGPKKAIPRMEFDFFFMLSCVTLELCVNPFYRLIHFCLHIFAAQSNVL